MLAAACGGTHEFSVDYQELLMKRSYVFISLLVTGALSAPLVTQASVIGTETSTNFIPFGSAVATPDYQQVYASADFSGTTSISSIEFYDPGVTATTTSAGSAKIQLVTTSAAVNGLSLNTPSNYSGTPTTVYSGKLTLTDGVLQINLPTAYNYNPANGNLLLQIVNNTGAALFSSLSTGFELDGSSGGLFSQVWTDYTANSSNTDNNTGLVTGFNSPVPLPSTGWLLLSGFGGLGILARKKRAA
jgi:hypothetical protein